MLLINRRLIRLSKICAGWIWAKVGVKLLVLVCVMFVWRSISGVQGSLYDGTLTPAALRRAVVFMLAVAVIRLIGNVLDGELSYRCTAYTRLTLRRRLLEKMLELEVGYSVTSGTAKVVTAAVDGVEALETYFTDYLPVLIYCAIAPWVMFWRMYPISHAAAWVLLATSLLVMPLNQLFKKIVQLLSNTYWKSYEGLNALYLENLEGLQTFKLFQADEERSDRLKRLSWDFRNTIMKAMRINFSASTLTEFVVYGGMAISVAIGGGLLGRGEISFGRAMYLLLLSDTFFVPVRAMMRSYHTAMNGIAAADNVFSMLQTQPVYRRMEKTSGTSHKSASSHEGDQGFVLENVTFSYRPGTPVIKNVNLRIPHGTTAAFVGASGCGKSTLASLLMNFFDPDSGSIRLDGTDLGQIDKQSLRKRVGIVPQNTYIFSGTIRENLLLAAPEADEKALLHVCTLVGLGDFLAKAPDGLDTKTGEAGQMLSGGQRQKIGIARMLLRNPEILIFDEATSNVDVESEQDIWDCIKALSKEKTVIIISHRLSTIRNADQIFFMQSGGIAESGTHAQLMASGGPYSRMAREQEALENYVPGGMNRG